MDIDKIETPDTRECTEGHGLMTPINLQYGYRPSGDGVIQATVQWFVVDEQIFVEGWALNEGVAQQLLSASALSGRGEWIAQAEERGVLRPYVDFSDAAEGHFCIDDNRPGHNQSYLVWDGSGEVYDDFRLMPDTVYHFFTSNPKNQPSGPELSDVAEVLSLRETDNVLIITDLGAHDPTESTSDESVKQTWNFENRVTVWDYFQIQRGLERRRTSVG